MRWARLPSPTFFEVVLCQEYFLEICFCLILKDIQNFFGPSIPRISSGALCSHDHVTLTTTIKNAIFIVITELSTGLENTNY